MWLVVSILYLGLLAWLGAGVVNERGWRGYGAGLLLSLAATALVSGLVYRVFALSLPIRVALIITIPVLLFFAKKWSQHREETSPSIPGEHTAGHGSVTMYGLFIVFGLSALAGLALLIDARTGEALRSPWVVISPLFLGAVFIAHSSALVLALTQPLRRWQTLAIGSTLVALATAIVPIIYKVGYGFDPFIHQTTVARILQFGAVDPKPLYYLGQYGLEAILATISHLPLSLLDAWLLPIIAIIALPIIISYALEDVAFGFKVGDVLPGTPSAPAGPNHKAEDVTGWGGGRTHTFMLATLTALPLTWFINTTPQGLANLILLAIIFLASLPDDASYHKRKPLLGFLAFTALVIHPLAGLPALTFLAFREAAFKTRAKQIFLILAGLAFLFAIPAALALKTSGAAATAAITNTTLSAQQALPFSWPNIATRFNLWLDLAYSYHIIIPLLLIVGGLFTYLPFPRYRQAANALWISFLLLFAIGLSVSTYVPATALIAYEQGAYGTRLMELSFLFLLPLLIPLLIKFWERLVAAPKTLQLFWILIIAALGTAGCYLTPPRFDNYAFDRGYSTSEHDIAAVKKIDKLANGRPYAVLANQALSAAALREFGFAHYFTALSPGAEPIFYYPIPTGGPLYNQYLKMVYTQPSQAIIDETRALIQTDLVFFVLNDYWFNAKSIKAQTESIASSQTEIGNGKVTIFEFDKTR